MNLLKMGYNYFNCNQCNSNEDNLDKSARFSLEMNEIIIINGYEYTKDEFDTIEAFVGSDIN